MFLARSSVDVFVNDLYGGGIGTKMQLNRVSCHWTINDMPLNRTSFYGTIFLMSLDRTSFYWIIRHSIGSYTSCHWIGLHFIGSCVYLLDRIFYVIGSGFMSLQHISRSGNHIRVIESIFMSLGRTIQVMPLHATGLNFMSLDRKRQSIGTAAY